MKSERPHPGIRPAGVLRGGGWLGVALGLALPLLGQAGPIGRTPGDPAPRIVAAIPEDFPPTYFRDPATGHPAGFAVDLLREIGRLEGFEVEFRFGKPWDELQQMVLDGRVDLIPNLNETPERSRLFAFTRHVETTPIAFFARASAGADFKPSLGNRVGVIRGSAAGDYLRSRPELGVVQYESLKSMLFDLLAGQLDLVLTASPNLQKLALDAGIDDRLRMLSPPVQESHRSMALRKQDQALLQRLNHGIDAFMGTPRYQEIYAKWWGRPRPFWTAQRVLLGSAGLALLLLVGMAYWRYRSIQQVLRDLAREVEDRKRAEVEAREGAARFRLLFEAMADAVFLIGPEGKFIEANQVAVDRLGYSREELLRLGPRDINPPLAAEAVARTFAKLKQEGRANFVTRHVRKDGSSLPVEIYSRRIDLDGTGLILSAARDISERIQAEEALAREADFARSVFNASEDCMAVVDAEGRILDVNEAWKRFGQQNGAGPETAWSVGANYFRPHCGGDDDGLAGLAYQGIRKVQSGELSSFDLDYPCNAPTEPRWFSMHVVPVKRKPGVVLVSHRNDTARRTALERIRESEAQLRTVTELSHAWEYWEGPLQQVEYMSPSCERITGYSREDFSRDPRLLREIVHPEDRATMAAHRHDFDDAGPGRLEFRIVRKDGEVRWIDHACRPVMGPDGRFGGRRVSNHDITDRKSAEEFRAQLAAIVASSDDAILSRSMEGIILTWNDAAERLFGYPSEEAVGRPISILLPQDRRSEEEHILGNIRQGEKVEHFETIRVAKDGRTIEVSITVSPIKDQRGRIVGAAKIVRDITERRQAEEALRQSEERYRRVAENLAEGLGVTSPAGVYTYCNRRFAQMFGYSQEEILRMTPLDLVRKEDHPMVLRKLKDRSQGRADRYELQMQRKDGTLLDCLLAVSPLLDEAGAYQGSLGLVTDITDKKIMEEALRKAEKAEALGEMAAGLAHDFNNQFQGILTHLELAQAQANQDPAIQRCLAKAAAGLQQAAGLSQRILEFTGASLRQPEKLELVAWLRAQEASLAAVAAQACSTGFRLDLQEREAILGGDPTQILAVLKVLVLNAAEAVGLGAPDGTGPIRVSLSRIAAPADLPKHLYWAEPVRLFPCVCLQVQDPGCGIRRGDERRVFDPFHTTKAPGRGLGLSAALGIVRAHGGGIGIGPCPEGGTLAAVCLQQAETEPAVPAPFPLQTRPSTAPDVRAGSILLADDEQVLLEVIAEVLENLGYPVVTATDGYEALERFRENTDQIRLVILDAKMPRMGGIESLQAMRALRPDLKALLCTGYGEAFGLTTAKEHGFAGFLGKPFKIEELKKALQAAMQ